MYTAIRIKNFRSIKNTVFTVKPGLNVLVGPNGSGKTNILHALKFISALLMNGAAVAMGKAGGPGKNFRRGEDEITFAVVSHYENSIYKGKRSNFLFRWEVSIALNKSSGLVQIARESIQVMEAGSPGVIRAEVHRFPGSFKSSVYMDGEEFLTKKMMSNPGRRPASSIRKSELHALVEKELSERLSSVKRAPLDASFLPTVRWLHGSVAKLLHELTSFNEYNIQPDIARQATDPLPQIRMEPDGRGVSEVINALESEQFRRISRKYVPNYFYYSEMMSSPLSYLWQDNYLSLNTKTNPLQDIDEHIRAAVTTIDSVSTELDPSSGRRFVVFKSGSNRFRPDEVSDGTIKWLCLLVATLVPQSRVILLEEPENFMHPWMQQRFVSLVREQAGKLNRSMIITTHSATVLNALRVDELLLVAQGDDGTVVDGVKDKTALRKVLKTTNFGLGDIWVSGGVGGVPGG